MNKTASLVIGILAIVVVVGGAAWLLQKKPSSSSSQTTASASPSPSPIVLKPGQTRLVIWSWGAPALGGLVTDFNKEYPDIVVDVQTYPHNEVERKIDLGITAGGELPDVIAMEGTIAPQYIQRGVLEDITSKVLPYKGVFNAYKWPEVSKNGNIYGVPWDSGPVAMFYRHSLFQEAGVDPATIQTWDDFIAAGKKLTKDTNGDGKIDQYMFILSKSTDTVDLFEMLLQQQGGTFFDTNDNVTINTPAGLRAARLMKQLSDEGISADIGYWTPEFYDSLKEDHVATYVQAAWLGSFIKQIAPDTKGDWRVIEMPAFTKGGVRSSNNGGSNLGISSKSKHKDAAWKFIEFALTRKTSQIKMYKDTTLFPSLTTVYTDPAFNTPDPFFGEQNTNELFIQTQKRLSANWHYGPYYREATKVLDKELALFLSEQKTAEQALSDATDQVKLLKK